MIEPVRRLRRALADFDVALLTVADANALVPELAQLEKACASAKGRAAERAAMRAEELAQVSGSSVGAAKAALDTVGLLSSCPDTAAALAAGEVSVDQAHEITRTAKEAPGSERELLQLARSSGLKTLKEHGRKCRHRAAGIDDIHRRQVAARAFRHWKNDLGNIAFCGELPPETGVPFVNRLEAECDRVRRDAKRAGSAAEERDAYRADAFVRMFNESGGRRAPSTELLIVADYGALLRGAAEAGEPCHVIGDGDIPVEVAKTLAEDALLRMVIHDGANPLRVKHFNRYIPAELKTVLKIGPPPHFEGLVCVDDGCERQAHLQLDHVDPFANWGPTSYQNLQPRCWEHHQEKTERDRKAGLLDGRGRPP